MANKSVSSGWWGVKWQRDNAGGRSLVIAVAGGRVNGERKVAPSCLRGGGGSGGNARCGGGVEVNGGNGSKHREEQWHGNPRGELPQTFVAASGGIRGSSGGSARAGGGRTREASSSKSTHTVR